MNGTNPGGIGSAANNGMGRIMLEVVPPSKRAAPESVAASVEKISAEINSQECIRAINIPEVIEENHRGEPYYRNIDTRLFGRAIFEKTGRKVVVNKVVAHLTLPEFEGWMGETVLNYGIKDMLFVGASRSSSAYAGPSVVQANHYASGIAASNGKFGGLNTGNILIPERENEVGRAVSKTLSGCSFFTTQILFQPKSFNDFIRKYCDECAKSKTRKSLFFLSFAPARNHDDIEFFKWLGCDIPAGASERFQKSGDMERASIELAKENLSDILSFIGANQLDVSLGLNIEAVFLQNLPLAMEMIRTFRHQIAAAR